MKDSKEVRSEYQSFVDAYGKIAEASVPEPEKERLKNTKSNPPGEPQVPLGGDRRPMVKCRKEGAFTEQAEKYQMSVKQFARFVEANQLLFSVDTRKKAQVANAFQGFKETAEWDEFFEDTEMVEDLGAMIDKASKKLQTSKHPVARAARAILSPAKGSGRGTARPTGGDLTKTNRPESLEWDEKEINDVILEVTTKETKSGTKYKVRVKHKETGSSYIRYATREMIAQMRNDPKISSVEMTDEGDAPEDKGEKKALEKGGGDLQKSDEKQDTKQAAEKGSGFAGKVKKRSVTSEAKKLDPVGKEDGDIDNDGDKDASDSYLANRRKTVAKAMGKKKKGDCVSKSEKGDHNCAKKVCHEQYGEGETIFGQHAVPDENGFVSHYDVQFEHGIVENVSVEDMEVITMVEHPEHVEHEGEVLGEGSCGSDKKKKKRKAGYGESYSDWRQDLAEVIKPEDEVGTIKEKGVKNKVEIMPKMEGKEVCPECKGDGCKHCDNKGYHTEMKNVMSSPDTQPVPKSAGGTSSGANAKTPNSTSSKPKGPLATLNRAKKGDGYFGPTVSAGGYRYGIPNPVRKEQTERKTLDEFLGGRPGDGYIGHPNLDIKNPLAKKQKKEPVIPKAKGGGLVNRVGASMGDIRMRQNQAIQNMR